jgi:hypothetical protein
MRYDVQPGLGSDCSLVVDLETETTVCVCSRPSHKEDASLIADLLEGYDAGEDKEPVETLNCPTCQGKNRPFCSDAFHLSEAPLNQ